MPESLLLVERTQVVAAFAGLTIMLMWESAHPFFRVVRETRPRHVVRNLAVGALNSAVIVFVFVTLWLWAAAFAEVRGIGLMNELSGLLGLPAWVHALGAMLVLDAWTYAWHRMNHAVPVLWRFHRVHHADAQMDVSTASRFHVGEIVLSSTLRIPLIIIVGVHVWELLLYETLMFAVVQFHHANIVLPERIDRIMRFVVVTPAMHKVHHSRWRPETDSNYSAFLSVWDRLFRSFRTNDRLESLRLGLDEFDRPEDATFKGVMTMPLAEIDRSPREDGRREVES